MLTALAGIVLILVAVSPQPLTAAGGALQTISGGGKEVGFLPLFTMNPRWELDVAAVTAACLEDPPAHLNCDPLPGGLDHAIAGVGLRNSGQGTIALRGLPAAAVPVQAMLYWGRITDTPERPDHLSIRFAGRLLTGELLEVTDDPCWNEFGIFAAYRADVPLDYLGDQLNTDYKVSLVGSATVDGTNPFNTDNGGDPPMPLDDGASLMVVYSEADVPASSRVWVHDGPFDMTIGAEFDHVLTQPIPAGTTEVRISRVGGDGQTQVDGITVLPYTTSIGRPEEDFLAFRGPYTNLDRTSDFSGFDSAPHNQLWDSATSDLVRADTGLLPGDLAYRLMYFATDTPPPCCCPPPQDAVAGDPFGNGIKIETLDPQHPDNPSDPGECGGSGPKEIFVPQNPRTIPVSPAPLLTARADGSNITPLPAPGAGDTVYLDCVVAVAHALTVR